MKAAYAPLDPGKSLLIGAACTDSCVLAKIVKLSTLPAPRSIRFYGLRNCRALHWY
ncbi:hypothetical protein SBA7_460018 [Candidatus Sulfotelmatobacter sp. SbA7]|nr:hypothetical protein SBA7_460018 [Candidatus Sulfotelmatobacter sp. SbA7]